MLQGAVVRINLCKTNGINRGIHNDLNPAFFRLVDL